MELEIKDFNCEIIVQDDDFSIEIWGESIEINPEKEITIEEQIQNFITQNIESFLVPLIPKPKKGDKGDKGDSVKWDKWDTPIKGVDYFTKKEVSEIKKSLKEAILSELPKIITEDEINVKLSDVLKKIPKDTRIEKGATFLRQLLDVKMENLDNIQYWFTYNKATAQFTLTQVSSGGSQNLQQVTDEWATTTHDIEANSFITTGGTSSQFVKGDGSLDSNTYIDWTLTEWRVPFASDSNTLEDDSSFLFDNLTDSLGVFPNYTQRVTNGSFTGSATGWTLNTGWTYNSNAVYHSSNGTGVLSQGITVYNGGLYRVTYTLIDPQTGSFTGTCTPTVWGVTLTQRNAIGTYTQTIVATNNSILTFTPSNTARFGIDNVSVEELSGGNIRSGNLYGNELTISGKKSDSSPWTTRHISLKNQLGNTYIDAYFGNILGGAIGFTSSALNLYAGSSGINFYRTPTSPSLIAYISDGAMVSYGTVAWQTGVNAGIASTSTLPSTLTTWGSFGARHIFISQNTTLTNAYTYVDANADLGSSCSGTPTYACSHWTNQSDCEKWDAHGGCVWSVVTCSDYSYTDQWTCEGHSGCTWDSVSCSGAYDEYSCLSQDDAYGGSCSWDVSYGDCSTFNWDEYTCSGTSGCTWDSVSCSVFNGDQSSCEWASGCSWSDPDCSGTYYPWTCSWTYESGYTCSGNYYIGNCSGSGGSCTGTSSCGGIDDSTNCGFETGCTWATGLTITMPTEWGLSTNFMRTYFIRNIATSANLTVNPNTDQTINGTTSLVIWPWKARHVSFSWFQVSCSTWDNTGESTCESGHTGCEWTSCVGLSEEDCNNAGGQCSWDSMESVCTGGGNCSGTWNVRRDWTVYGWVF